MVRMADPRSKLVSLYVRLPRPLRQELDGEVSRQNRKQEFVVGCFINHCLQLPPEQRDSICTALVTAEPRSKRLLRKAAR